MHLGKKILCSISIFTLLFSQFFIVEGFSQKEYLAKEKIMARADLHKIVKGRSYSKSVDTLVQELKNNEAKIAKVGEKIEQIIEKLEEKNTLNTKEKQTLVLLQYIHASIEYQQFLTAEEKSHAVDTKIDNIIQEVKKAQLSQSEKQKVEKIFVDLQQKFIEDLESNYKDLSDYLVEKTNYQAQGDLNLTYDVNTQVLGQYLGEINLQDYTITNSLLDSQITGELEAVIEAIPQGKDSVKTQFSSFIDYIYKNGGIYVLLKDLEITTSEQNEEIKEFIQRAKELAQENKYLEISDAQTQYIYESINQINDEKLFGDLYTLSEQSLFTSYKNIDDTYYIIPTKYACDSAKKLGNVFDPFGGETCSESQYNKLLTSFLSVGEVTLTIGSQNTLSLNAYEFEGIENFDFDIDFNENEITAINFSLAPDQNIYPEDEISIKYEKNNLLTALFSVTNINTYAKLDAQLDNNNRIETLDFQAKSTQDSSIISSEFEYKNNLLDGNISIQEVKNTYDENWNVTGKKIAGEFAMDIQATTDYYNDIKSIESQFYYVEDDQKILEGDFTYNLPQVSFNLQIVEDYSNSEFVLNFDSKFNSDENYFYDLDFKSHLISQKSEYNYDTWESTYVGEPMKLFEADYVINNGTITGEANIKNYDNEELFSIQTNGKYFGTKGDIKNIITLSESMNINSQIKKARNSTRIMNLKAIQSALEQSYQDYGEYPSYEEFNQKVSEYLYTIPTDEFAGKIIDGCEFGFKYEVGDDQYAIENQVYILSTCLEKTGNWEDKLTQDYGIDENRYEVGHGFANLSNQGVFINSIDTWEKYDNTLNDGKPVINYDIIFDYTNNQTNLELFIDAFLGENKAAEIYFKNTGNIKYAPQNIQKPEKTAPINEILY